jgi:hypothetical protein
LVENRVEEQMRSLNGCRFFNQILRKPWCIASIDEIWIYIASYWDKDWWSYSVRFARQHGNATHHIISYWRVHILLPLPLQNAIT